MAINPNKDILSDTERQDYQRWAINDHYLPEASAAGGCDGNLERACITIVDGVLEFCNRQNLHLKREHDVFLKLNNHTGLCDILCRLQELVCDLVTWSQTSICSHFPFQVFYQRLAAHEANEELSDNLIKQGQLEMCSRILLGLPPLLLVTIRYDRGTCMLSSKDFFQFVNKHLKNIGPRGCALPYNITAHFFRGVVSASARCEDPSEAVNSILVESYALCPILIVSAALWWPQLDPMLNSQWSYLHGVALPKELEIMKEQQTSIDNFLSQGEKLPTHGPAWLTAAFLNFTIERKKIAHRQILEVLCRLNSTEMLLSLLFFSTMELICMLLKEGKVLKDVQEKCVQIIHCLEEKGECWVLLFKLAGEREPEFSRDLHKTVSDVYLKLLPFAFFCLVPSLQLECVVQQVDFLDIALQMYSEILQLFEAKNILGSLTNFEHLDSYYIFTNGRQFLLQCLPRCKKPHPATRKQMLECWLEQDPELATVLKNSFKDLDDFDDLCNFPLF